MEWLGLKRTLHRFRWRANSPVWQRRFARSAGLWALLAMVATALYVGFISPNSQASVSGALQALGQCRVNAYDCRDFTTQFEVQAVYWACGGRQNDVHRLDRDRDGWACARKAQPILAKVYALASGLVAVMSLRLGCGAAGE
jgi:hypothetical protein